MLTKTEPTTAVAIPAVDALAVAIQREHVAASTAARAALDHALEAGRLLAEARPGIRHGEWETFVRDRCGLATRTARLYLQLDANRARVADRQRVAGLTVREAARLVAEARNEIEPEAGTAVDCVGPHWLKLTPVSAEFTPGWTMRLLEPIGSTKNLPRWYAPGCWHRGEHGSGWSFEVSPDRFDAGRVNTVVHDPTGTVHLACFDGMNPAGILPFMASCERHHATPKQSGEWKVSTVPVSVAPGQLAPVFPFRVFELAYARHHVCYCWPMIDEAIGLAAGEGDPGHRAWLLFMRALVAIVKHAPQ